MALPSHSGNRVQSYNFTPGRILARKYEVVAQVGKGHSHNGELYMLHERATGIDRTARFFFPHLHADHQIAAHYAQKLHRLRHCHILMQYRSQETISVAGTPVTFLVSDHLEGQFLREHLAARPFKRMPHFEGLHLLRALASGVEQVHRAGDFHGELHPDNIMVRRVGLCFKVKLLDLAPAPMREFNPAQVRAKIRGDVVDLVAIFHEAIGGESLHGKFPNAVRDLLSDRSREGLEARFRNASELSDYLDNLSWGRNR